MNILMVRPRLEAGGATKSIILLSEGLSKAGHRLTVATHSGDWLKTIRQLNIGLYLLPLYPSSALNFVRSAINLLKIIHREQIDLLHSHHRFSNLVCQFVSQLSGVPTVSTVHEFKDNQIWLTRWGLRQHVIVFSESLKVHLNTHYGVPSHRISVVKMGIQPELPSLQTIAAVREKFNLPQEGIMIGCISRLSEEKGISILLRAISQVKKAGHQAHYLVIGEGPQKSELEYLSSQLDLDDQVHFLGWQDEISAIIAHLDFLVLPSLSEGLGLVVLEGLAQAKPTIGSRTGGIPEIIQDGTNGLLVSPGHVDELARAIIYLLKNLDVTTLLGQTGQQRLADFSVEAMIKQTEQVYLQALQQNI